MLHDSLPKNCYALLPLRFDTGRRIEARALAITHHDLYREQCEPPTLQLARTRGDPRVRPTSLGALARIYERHGWVKEQQLESDEAEAAVDATLEPVLTQPLYAYSMVYHVLGIAASVLEDAVAEFEPGFALERALRQVCRDHTLPLDQVFPQLTDVSAHFALVQKRARPGQQPAPPPPEGRVLPLSTLPFVLAQLPRCYQAASNTLWDCEQLPLQLRDRVPFTQLPGYVHTQLHLLERNRRYLLFVAQQALLYCTRPLRHCDEERALMEARLAALLDTQAEERAEEEERRAQLRARTRALACLAPGSEARKRRR